MIRLLFVAASLLALAAPAHADPDALWKITHDKCVPDQQEHGQPAPCAKVDLNAGYVILKDLIGDTQYLLMPTAKITGIDDPAVLAPDARNYFADSWAERHYTEDAAKRALPRETLSLAINSVTARSQNQLHIHIDCLKPQVIAILRKQKFSDRWSPVHFASLHTYEARRLDSDDLDENPFTLLAAHAKDMSRETLVVAGSEDGFILLSDTASGSDKASGEELLDHECAVNQMKE